MSEQPQVSVVITTRNQSELVTRAVRSALPNPPWRRDLIGKRVLRAETREGSTCTGRAT
jgi:hypothetical protein